MKLVYVAGKFGDPSVFRRSANTLQALGWSGAIIRAGMGALCPHAALGPLHGEFPEKRAMAVCLEMLSRCDAVFLLPGWEDSRGSRKEVLFASKKGTPVFTDFVKLLEWAEETK
jgi:hypothetical protein